MASCLHKFRVCHETHRLPKIVVADAIHWENGHVFVASLSVDQRCIASRDVSVSIYTEDGKLVHNFAVNLSKIYRYIPGITITSQGRIALALCNFPENVLKRRDSSDLKSAVFCLRPSQNFMESSF